MADEYIKREALLNEARKRAQAFSVALIYEAIKEAPAADVVEVVHGEWIAHGYKWRCSVCNCKLNLDGTPMENGFYFCPNCGAKMDGGKE